MNNRKKVNWVITFSVLSAFSFTGIRQVFGESSINVALAQVTKENNNGENNQAVIIENGENGGEGNSLANKFGGSDLVCSVNKDQFRFLQREFKAMRGEVQVAERVIEVVKINSEKITNSELRRLLDRWNGEQPLNCRTIKHRGLFYLLFNAHMS